MSSKPALRREILVRAAQLTAAQGSPPKPPCGNGFWNCVGALEFGRGLCIDRYGARHERPARRLADAGRRYCCGIAPHTPAVFPTVVCRGSRLTRASAIGSGPRRSPRSTRSCAALAVAVPGIDSVAVVFYDRALARAADVLTIALLYEHELLDEIPVQPHDRPVDVAATPSALHRFIPRRS